jgi:hypothetical protein
VSSEPSTLTRLELRRLTLMDELRLACVDGREGLAVGSRPALPGEIGKGDTCSAICGES